jgi:hypothetical protein
MFLKATPQSCFNPGDESIIKYTFCDPCKEKCKVAIN